jgi:hypothetical protein
MFLYCEYYNRIYDLEGHVTKKSNTSSLSSLSLYGVCMNIACISSIPGRGKRFFSLLHNVPTGCGTHPSPYTIGTEDRFPEGNAAGT